jgi:predicted lactoylglutathione lyase
MFRVLDCGTIQLCFHSHEAYQLLALDNYSQPAGVAQLVTFDALSREEVDQKTTRAQELGAKLVKGPFITYYNHYQVVCFDPDNNVFRITIPNPA